MAVANILNVSVFGYLFGVYSNSDQMATQLDFHCAAPDFYLFWAHPKGAEKPDPESVLCG